MNTVSFHESVHAAVGQLQHVTGWKTNFAQALFKSATLEFSNLPGPLLPGMETVNMACPLFSIINTMPGHLIGEALAV